MNWPEIKKAVNSDISTPLNHLMWLEDYKTYGEKSYVYNHKDKLHELYNNYDICMNDLDVSGDAFEYVISEGAAAGKVLAHIYGIENADVLSSLTTIDDVANNSTAMGTIVDNAAAMDIVLKSATAMTSIANNSTAMGTIVDNAAAMNALVDNAAAMNIVMNSATAMTSIANSATGTGVIINSGKAMNVIAKAEWDAVKPFILKLCESRENLLVLRETLRAGTYFKAVDTNQFSSTQEFPDGYKYFADVTKEPNQLLLCTLGYTGNWVTGSSKESIGIYKNGELVKKVSSVSPDAVDRPTDLYKPNAICVTPCQLVWKYYGAACFETYEAL